MLKKFLLASLMLFNFLLIPATQVFAQTDLSQDIANKSGYGSVTGSTVLETVARIIKTALSLVGTIFLALTVYAGFLWMTAAGDETKIEKAVSILKTSVIGLVIILASYSITYFVLISTLNATS